MLREEFEHLITTKKPTDDEWELVTTIYTFHPSISEVVGKKQIAKLWDIGGVRLMADMVKTAERVRSIEEHIAEHRAFIADYERQLQDIKEGN